MDIVEELSLLLLCIFYTAYIIKAFSLRSQGIDVNLLGKGSKPKSVLIVEKALKVLTLFTAFIQFISIIFKDRLTSINLPVQATLVGLLLMSVGVIFFIAAMTAMKSNWRAGFDEDQNTSLVSSGIYSISRNPAFVGFDLLYIGSALVYPNPILLIATIGGIVLFHFQILAEEVYCSNQFDETYKNYKSSVHRYLGKKHTS